MRFLVVKQKSDLYSIKRIRLRGLKNMSATSVCPRSDKSSSLGFILFRCLTVH